MARITAAATVIVAAALALAAGEPLATRQWWKQWGYNCTKNVFMWDGDYTKCRDFGVSSPVYIERDQRSPINIDTFGDGVKTFTNFKDAEFVEEVQSFMRHADNFKFLNNLLPEVAPDIKDPIPQYVKLRHDSLDDAETYQTSYMLERMVFHTPSEHTVDRMRYPLEVQFYMAECVKQDCEGGAVKDKLERRPLALSVFGITTEDELVKPLIHDVGFTIKYLEQPEEKLSGGFNPNMFLPEQSGFWKYMGSETAPPCEPAVQWVVMQHAVNVSHDFVDAIKTRVEQWHPDTFGNARPLQVQWEPDPLANPPIEGTKIEYHKNNGEILTPMSVATLSDAQAYQKAKFNRLFSVNVMDPDPNYWFWQRYELRDRLKCFPEPVQPLDYGITPNTPPEILRLRPDISVQDTGGTSKPLTMEEEDALRTPQYSAFSAVSDTSPTKEKAKWVKGLADRADLVEREEACIRWRNEGMPKGDVMAPLCQAMIAELPLSGSVHGNYPMPPPTKPPDRLSSESKMVYPPLGKEGYPTDQDEVLPYFKDYTFDEEHEAEMDRLGKQIVTGYDMIANDGRIRRFMPDTRTPVYGKEGNMKMMEKPGANWPVLMPASGLPKRKL